MIGYVQLRGNPLGADYFETALLINEAPEGCIGGCIRWIAVGSASLLPQEATKANEGTYLTYTLMNLHCYIVDTTEPTQKQRCWAEEGDARPTFVDILATLERIKSRAGFDEVVWDAASLDETSLWERVVSQGE